MAKKKYSTIIVIQPLGLGDLVAVEPISRYLKNHYPNVKLLWACQEFYRELIDSNPNIDGMITINNVLEINKLKKELRRDKNIRLLDLTMSDNIEVNSINYYFYGSLIEAFCLSAGIPKLCQQPLLYFSPSTKEKVNKLNLPKRFIAVNRFSKGATRSLDIKKWDIILNYVVNNYGYKIIEVGGDDIKILPKANINTQYYLDLRGKLSILEAAEVIKKAEYFIGVDSAPAHLANAVKTKGVIACGIWMGRFKKYVPFSGFFRDNRNIRYARNLHGPVKDLSPNKVIEAIESLINNIPYENIAEPYSYIEAKKLKKFIYSSEEYMLWGAGGMGVIYKKILEKMGRKIVCFLDSDVRKHDTYLMGTPVYHHSILKTNKTLNNIKVIISSIFWDEISTILKRDYNKVAFKDYI